jgi:hypothetical protein
LKPAPNYFFFAAFFTAFFAAFFGAAFFAAFFVAIVSDSPFLHYVTKRGQLHQKSSKMF